MAGSRESIGHGYHRAGASLTPKAASLRIPAHESGGFRRGRDGVVAALTRHLQSDTVSPHLVPTQGDDCRWGARGLMDRGVRRRGISDEIAFVDRSGRGRSERGRVRRRCCRGRDTFCGRPGACPAAGAAAAAGRRPENRRRHPRSRLSRAAMHLRLRRRCHRRAAQAHLFAVDQVLRQEQRPQRQAGLRHRPRGPHRHRAAGGRCRLDRAGGQNRRSCSASPCRCP